MPQTVLKCDKTIIKKMQSFYQSSITPKLVPGSIFIAKTEGCTITAYKSGKVLFQGNQAEREAEKWGENETSSKITATNKKSIDSHHYAPPSGIKELAVIGSDEVGTGDYFGPMTVAAVFTGPLEKELLMSSGVKDSKLLTDARISQIAQRIMPKVTYSLLTLPNEKYNELQQKGYSQGKMKAFLHNQAIKHVIKKLNGNSYDGILIDQFATPQVYFNYLKDENNVVKDKVYFQTKAESVHLSVAVASIIARHVFLEEMDRLSHEVGHSLPKGAGSKVDSVAADIIKTKGFNELNHIAKLHFANTEKAKRL